MCVSFLLFVESVVVMEDLMISQVISQAISKLFELLKFVCGVVVLFRTIAAVVVDSSFD
jgi:hypothetical protein